MAHTSEGEDEAAIRRRALGRVGPRGRRPWASRTPRVCGETDEGSVYASLPQSRRLSGTASKRMGCMVQRAPGNYVGGLGETESCEVGRLKKFVRPTPVPDATVPSFEPRPRTSRLSWL
jgi:hypothetical protein